MERITRALERAHAEREARADRHDPKLAVINPRGVVPEPAVELTDTIVLRTPIIEIDPKQRERERILPPGASGPIGGAYKMLRTQVLRRLDQLGANTLGVMSASAGEGKTLTALNLAIAIAADPGRTALLVDLDLRRPGVIRRLGVTHAVGIEECLEAHRPIQDAMFKVAGYERLTVLAARERREDSSELLSSARVAELVTELRTRYANRIVIFDVPPILQADDALALSRCLQAGLLVIGDGRTQREDVARSLELLRDLPFVGTVLNGARETAANYY